MKLINCSVAVLLLLGAIATDEAAAIRVNGEPAAKKEEAPAAAKTAEEKGSDEIKETIKKATDKEGGPKSPFCTLEGRPCREREGYKASDDEGTDDDLKEPEGMVHSNWPGFKGDSEANKASDSEPKELKMNATVKVEMAKWFPNKEKVARINATKIAIKKEEEKRVADRKKRKEDMEERKKKRAKDREEAAKKAKAQLEEAKKAAGKANSSAKAKTAAKAQANVSAETNASKTSNASANASAMVNAT